MRRLLYILLKYCIKNHLKRIRTHIWGDNFVFWSLTFIFDGRFTFSSSRLFLRDLTFVHIYSLNFVKNVNYRSDFSYRLVIISIRTRSESIQSIWRPPFQKKPTHPRAPLAPIIKWSYPNEQIKWWHNTEKQQRYSVIFSIYTDWMLDMNWFV